MATKAFSPQALRGILIVLLVIVIAGGAGLFYLGIDEVRKFATEVNHTNADAEASRKQVQEIQNLKGQLTQSESLIAKANQMFATQENYQAQAITDIRNYANASGLTITKTSFEDQPGAVNERTMVVSLQSPVSYKKLLQFLDGVEGNIPKMQVSTIHVGHANGGADSVSIEDIKITIATR